MSIEIPSDLIRRIQTTLRKSAGIPSSYDPDDASLPSLDDALSALDGDDDPSSSSSSSSSPLARCGKCRRSSGLVRGAHSTLCIFCGRDRRRDGVSHSLSFTSTVACKTLLQSLKLDGSEIIDLDSESNDSKRAQDKQHDGMTLLSMLDLELKWPPEKEEVVSRSNDKASVSVRGVNLSGVDLDSFFSDSNNKTSSGALSVSNEELMPKQVMNTDHVSSGPENFDSFKDLKMQDVAVSSDNTKGGRDSDSFADWDAGFQSASSQDFHAQFESPDLDHGSSTTVPATSEADVTVAVESKSVDLFMGSTTTVSNHATPAYSSNEHMNMDYEASNEVDSSKPTSEWDHTSSTDNWIHGDLWPSTNDQLHKTNIMIDSESKDDVHHMISTVDSGPDAMQATDSMKPSNINSKPGNDAFDDSFDLWKELASSNEPSGVPSSSWRQSDAATTFTEPSPALKSMAVQDVEFGNFLHPHSFSGNLDEQGGQNIVNNTKESNNVIDENSLETWQGTSSNGASGDLLNLWTQTTTGSTKEQATETKSMDAQVMELGSFTNLDSISEAFARAEDPAGANAVKLDIADYTNRINNFDNRKQNDDDDDGWDDFTSSKEAPGVFPNLWTSSEEAGDHPPGVKSVNHLNSDFSGFVSLDSFPGVSNQEVNNFQLDTLDSKFNAEYKSNSDMNNDEDDLFGSWNVASLNKVPEALPNLSTHKQSPGIKSVDSEAMGFGDFLESDMFSGVSSQKDLSKQNNVKSNAFAAASSINELNNTKNTVAIKDPFESWQGFFSSNATEGSANFLKRPDSTTASHEHTSETKSMNLPDMGSGSLLYSDSSSPALGDSRAFGKENHVQDASVSYRMNGLDERMVAVSVISEAAEANDDNVSALNNESTNSKIESLLSQMPDLSFMLDDNLSIPNKVDSSN